MTPDTPMLCPLAGLTAFLSDYTVEIVGCGIVLVGLLLIGLRDVARFSIRRVWALSGLVWRESIRRRVLWITPVALLGVIVVAQLQRPTDEQDAVRQTIKYCLFATGMLVTLATIILACTSLPKEIDTRVIYTIVTKPPTRLEIVVGKIVGFARVSAAILGIMGLFTFAYVESRAAQLRAAAGVRLGALPEGDALRPTLEHYRDFGLVHAKTYAAADDVQVYSRLPAPGEKVRWMFGNAEADVLVPFDLPAELLPEDMPENLALSNALVIRMAQPPEFQFVQHPPQRAEWQRAGAGPAPAEEALPSPQVMRPAQPLAPWPLDWPGHKKTGGPPAALPPGAAVSLLSEERYNLAAVTEVHNGSFALPRAGEMDLDPETAIYVPAPFVDKLRQLPPSPGGGRRVYVRLEGPTPFTEYGVGPVPVRLFSPVLRATFEPAKDPSGRPSSIFRGRIGSHGQQLRGGDPDRFRTPVAVYSFRNRAAAGDAGGDVRFEMRFGIERGGSEARTDAEDVTLLSVAVLNHASGELGPPKQLRIESGRNVFLGLPAGAVRGGNFDVVVRCLTAGHYVGLRGNSITMVAGEQSFAANLLKSLFVLWLMSLLVVVVGVFCSTFLSWPIAVVLTLVLLLGRWGVIQLGSATAPGMAVSITSDLFGSRTNPAALKVVSSGVELMARMLNTVSRWLPDISTFAASESVERGESIRREVVTDSLKVTFGFGLPLTVLAYLFLWKKEVAP